MIFDKFELEVLRALYQALQKKKFPKADRSIIDSICVELIKPKKFSKKQLYSIAFTVTQTMENAIKEGNEEMFNVLKKIVDKTLAELTLKE